MHELGCCLCFYHKDALHICKTHLNGSAVIHNCFSGLIECSLECRNILHVWAQVTRHLEDILHFTSGLMSLICGNNKKCCCILLPPRHVDSFCQDNRTATDTCWSRTGLHMRTLNNISYKCSRHCTVAGNPADPDWARNGQEENAHHCLPGEEVCLRGSEQSWLSLCLLAQWQPGLCLAGPAGCASCEPCLHHTTVNANNTHNRKSKHLW